MGFQLHDAASHGKRGSENNTRMDGSQSVSTNADGTNAKATATSYSKSIVSVGLLKRFINTLSPVA